MEYTSFWRILYPINIVKAVTYKQYRRPLSMHMCLSIHLISRISDFITLISESITYNEHVTFCSLLFCSSFCIFPPFCLCFRFASVLLCSDQLARYYRCLPSYEWQKRVAGRRNGILFKDAFEIDRIFLSSVCTRQ